MDMARKNTLDLIVNTESTKYANWSAFLFFLQVLKAITWSFEV